LFPYDGLQDPKNGSLLSVDDTLAVYRRALRAGGPQSIVPRPDRDPRDGTKVTRTTWGPKPADAPVTLFTVHGGGNPWPGGAVQTRTSATRGRTSRDLDASAVIGHFVLDTRRPTKP
jgi:poly(3-hydroxybutyrate) depolymerase